MINILLSECNFNEPWISDRLKNIINSESKVCIIPFSFHDELIKNAQDFSKYYDKENGEYYTIISHSFRDFGVKDENINYINYFTDNAKTACKIINDSDILLLPGGLPDKLLSRIEKFNIKSAIENFNGTVIGFSAGALAQLQNYHISPDKDYPSFGYYRGLNMIKDFYIEVHFENTGIQNYSIRKVLSEKKKPLYTISNKGGILVDNGTVETFGDVDLYMVK